MRRVRVVLSWEALVVDPFADVQRGMQIPAAKKLNSSGQSTILLF